MNSKLSLLAVLGGLTLLCGCGPFDEPEEDEALAGAPYVFVGTILEPRSSTIDLLPASDETFTVRIDDVIFQKGVFADLTGSKITLIAADRKLESGTKYLFYTEPVIFGRSVAVQLVAAKPGTRPDPDAVRQAYERHEIGLELRRADLVIQGRIDEVKPYEKQERRPLTEHWPDLRVASLGIEQVLKGSVPDAKRVDLLFSGSRDVQWYQSPKLKAGDAAVFLLERGSDRAKHLRIGDQSYTLFRPLSVQPLERVGTIKELLK